jgi:hypothetical protein
LSRPACRVEAVARRHVGDADVDATVHDDIDRRDDVDRVCNISGRAAVGRVVAGTGIGIGSDHVTGVGEDAPVRRGVEHDVAATVGDRVAVRIAEARLQAVPRDAARGDEQHGHREECAR